jgi:hypothetical protein
MFSTTGDDNLLALECEAVVLFKLLDDGVFEGLNAGNGCILCETLVDCIDCRLFYVLGGIKIRLRSLLCPVPGPAGPFPLQKLPGLAMV